MGQLYRAACMASSLPSSVSDMGVSSGPGLTQCQLSGDAGDALTSLSSSVIRAVTLLSEAVRGGPPGTVGSPAHQRGQAFESSHVRSQFLAPTCPCR